VVDCLEPLATCNSLSKGQADPQMSADFFTSSKPPFRGGGFAAASAGGRAFGLVSKRVLVCCTSQGNQFIAVDAFGGRPDSVDGHVVGGVDRCGMTSGGIQAGRRSPGHFHCGTCRME
jgi:hypothetical protein